MAQSDIKLDTTKINEVLIAELQMILKEVPMPTQSYEQIENRLSQIRKEKVNE